MPENSSDLTFEQIEVGLCKEFHVDITQSMVDDFAKISGDFNPIHMNEEFAKSTKFGGKIVHGMLLASFLSRMVGMYLPGKYALYLEAICQCSSVSECVSMPVTHGVRSSHGRTLELHRAIPACVQRGQGTPR